MLYVVASILAHILIPYILAIVMPNWHWLLCCVIVVGGAIAWQWSQHWTTGQAPAYELSAGGIIGLALMSLQTISFVWGILMRSLSLVLSYTGWSGRRVFAVNVAGFFFMLAGLASLFYIDVG